MMRLSGCLLDRVGALVVVDIDADGAGLTIRRPRRCSADASGRLAPRDAVGEPADAAQAVEVADALAGVAPEVVVLALHLVELFDHREGDDDVVLFEDEEGVGVVEQDVGVDHERLGLQTRNSAFGSHTPKGSGATERANHRSGETRGSSACLHRR
jgi:hypothetical protein